MILRLTRPHDSWIKLRLDAESDAPWSYENVGITQTDTSPAGSQAKGGLDVDRRRNRLGHGQDVFTRACQAFNHWKMFDVGWVSLCFPDTSVEPGAVVGVLANTYHTWTLNISRILYVLDDEQAGVRRYGFAYGTLPHHVEQGEELFAVEWDMEEDVVWYTITAFSRPCHPLVRLAYPLARKAQRRFGHDSLAAMRRAVAE